MPRGTEHRVVGLLVADPRGFVLEVDGGGRWQLDVSDYGSARDLCNHRVVVTGRRAGFDLLEVETLTPIKLR